MRTLLVGGALTALLSTAALLWLRTSLPVYSGVQTLKGLHGDVDVVFDRHAIPHIRATAPQDAYRALGFVHAQDRLFQMDFMRRLGAGRLSEVVGRPTYRLDRAMRTLGLYRLAQETYNRLPEDTQSALDAYAEGVNAFLATRSGTLPPEFVMLRYAPEEWKPADSLVWGRLMAMQLTGNWRTEALRAALSKRLSPEQISDLWPKSTIDVPPTLATARIPDFANIMHNLLDGLPAWLRQISASNSWVVSGNRTATGKPLMANDPHLGFRAPGLWYLARVEAPGLNVTGATAPGVPFHILGHNGHIAWSFTTTDSDTQDLYLERRTRGNQDTYDTPAGPRKYAIRMEEIVVRDQPRETVKIRASRHGPIISDVYPRLRQSTAERYDVALAAAGLRADDLTPLALMRLNRAKNWDEFTGALQSFHAPQQNISYADGDGNIGMYAPGRVPVRNTGEGKVPSPGWTGTHGWRGFVPYDALPRAFNPVSGAAINANHRLVPRSYPWFLTDDWSAPYRAKRLHELLDVDERHSATSFARIQNDVLSLAATQLTPLFLRHLRPQTGIAGEIADMIAVWDGTMSRERSEPLIFSTWLAEINKAMYADELGPLFEGYYGQRPLAIEHMLTRRQTWCDDVGTRAAETCDDIVTRSFETAISALSEKYGNDHERWLWGKAHQATFAHPIFGRIPVLRHLSDIRIDSGGGAYTVNRAQPRLTDPQNPFASIHGPGYRAIYDLSDLNASLFATATGQSGNMLSAYYDDNIEAWRDGQYIKIPKSREDALQGAIGVLTLTPAQ